VAVDGYFSIRVYSQELCSFKEKLEVDSKARPGACLIESSLTSGGSDVNINQGPLRAKNRFGVLL